MSKKKRPHRIRNSDPMGSKYKSYLERLLVNQDGL